MLLRQLANQKQRHLAFRDRRAYLFAHAAEFVPSEESDLVGTLKISGYVRGQALNVNSVLHIIGHGDFQMKQVDAPVDPFPLNPRVIKSSKDSGTAMEICAADAVARMEEDLKVLMKADPDRQESLQTEVIPDPMEGEQTWPTEEELSEAHDLLKESSKVVKKVPKGTSSYQAEWILDEDGESGGEGDEYDDIEHEDFMEEESQDEGSEEEEEEECETMTIGESVRDDLYDEKVDEEAEEKMLEKYKQQRLEEMFPDEVDTPVMWLLEFDFRNTEALRASGHLRGILRKTSLEIMLGSFSFRTLLIPGDASLKRLKKKKLKELRLAGMSHFMSLKSQSQWLSTSSEAHP